MLKGLYKLISQRKKSNRRKFSGHNVPRNQTFYDSVSRTEHSYPKKGKENDEMKDEP